MLTRSFFFVELFVKLYIEICLKNFHKLNNILSLTAPRSRNRIFPIFYLPLHCHQPNPHKTDEQINTDHTSFLFENYVFPLTEKTEWDSLLLGKSTSGMSKTKLRFSSQQRTFCGWPFSTSKQKWDVFNFKRIITI